MSKQTLYQAKGLDTGSLTQWLRIIKNLTLNTRIDDKDTYRRAIDGINKLAGNWDSLLLYFAGNGIVSGFSQEQIDEERIKARMILQNKKFAETVLQGRGTSIF
ncbi:MAG: hypothetical protein ACOX6I_04245 [Syntrophomonadaceae bacterium]|jgi:hypothetical protein